MSSSMRSGPGAPGSLDTSLPYAERDRLRRAERAAARRPTALDAFIEKKSEFDALIARLTALSDDHFNVGPDEVTWGWVGSLSDWVVVLRRISDAAFGEGEHAG